MREIKFRAWSKQDNRMLWNVGVDAGGCAILDTRHRGIMPLKGESILMQYTGLKDKNGKEYADCDIMQWRQVGYTSKRLEKVVWHEAGWWIADLISGDLLIPLTATQAELRTIIGNIYENPELLEATHEQE